MLYSLLRLLLIAAAFAPIYIQAEITAIYLTWQRAPESTMTICWLTPTDIVDDSIDFHADTQEPAQWFRASGTHKALPQNAPYFKHVVELTNLQADTRYVFRVANESKEFKFRTAPAKLNKEVSFVAGGDMYHDTVEILSATNKQAAKTAPLFVLIGGDIAYAAGKGVPSFFPRFFLNWFDEWRGQKFDRWLVWLKAWSTDMVTPEGCLIPLLPTIGNHEVNGGFDKTPKEAPFFYSLFPMPGKQGYNVIDFGNYMSIVLLDSGHTHPVKGAQAKWLAQTLAARQHVKHKFAIYHVPAYPSVRSENNEISTAIRNFWVPSFDQYHLTAAFENHDHAYKRTYPLTASEYDPNGVIYLGDGSWGIEDPRAPRGLKKKNYLEVTAEARYFHRMTIDAEKRTMQAITPSDTLIDQHTW